MQKSTKIKLIISAVSIAFLYPLAAISYCLIDFITRWEPILSQRYFASTIYHYIGLIGCGMFLVFLIVLNLVIWLYNKIFKD